MAIYRIADFLIEIDSRYDYLPRQCAAYLAKDATAADFCISVPEEDIDREQAAFPNFTRGYHESLCAYRMISMEILHRDAFLMHAAVVAVDGRAYAFSAQSGTGKTTHITLWRRYFGERVQIINGDKPIIRRKGDEFIAYGTPWCGKEGWQRNTSAPLGAICFLERSLENYIHPLDSGDAVMRIFHQLLRPRTAAEMDKTMTLADGLLRQVPVYLLGCDISREAAELSFRTMTGQK